MKFRSMMCIAVFGCSACQTRDVDSFQDVHSCVRTGDSNPDPATGATLEELTEPWEGVAFRTDIPGLERLVATELEEPWRSNNTYYHAACGLGASFEAWMNASVQGSVQDTATLHLLSFRGPTGSPPLDDRVRVYFGTDALGHDFDQWVAEQDSSYSGPPGRVEVEYESGPFRAPEVGVSVYSGGTVRVFTAPVEIEIP